jgi:hypothetical protein
MGRIGQPEWKKLFCSGKKEPLRRNPSYLCWIGGILANYGMAYVLLAIHQASRHSVSLFVSLKNLENGSGACWMIIFLT